jgi:hypothetical protein
MKISQIDVTGSKVIGAISELGHVGPKHHAIVLGENKVDGKVYLAENMHTGYQVSTYDDFFLRYGSNGRINIEPNSGAFSDFEVAQRALNEIFEGGKGVYNLVANNCESFANRAMHNKSTSKQVVNTFLGIALFAGTIWVIRNANK